MQRWAILLALAVSFAGCGQSRADHVASLVDWGPVDCKGLVRVYRPVKGLGRQWERVATDQAQIECGMDGPAVTWSTFNSAAEASRETVREPPGAPYCLAGREVVVDLFDFHGRANARA